MSDWPPGLASTHDAGMFAGFLDLPIHPAFVHFPIAFLTAGWVLTYVRHWRNRPSLEPYARTSLAVGVAALPFTIITGFRDANWSELFSDWVWSDPLMWHFLLAVGAAVLFTTHFALRTVRSSISPRVDIVMTTAGVWLLVMTGLIAAEIVYA